MQENIWENEYKNPKLISLSSEPAMCIKDFVRFLKRDQKIELSNLNILDLGCGNAKNSNYIAEQGINNRLVGIDISETAIKYAEKQFPNWKFIKGDIGKIMPFKNEYFDIILDITSSNSLTEKERMICLKEIQRVMKKGGYLFIRTLCKDGDKNAKNLLKSNPGKEKDTYIMPGINLTEKVWSKDDLLNYYSDFELLYLEKETHYTRFNGKSYKRNFWIACFIKK
ncbi:MAG: class I SAM-dependent methyltransferase [Patescibacteria group bacterium]